MINPEEHRRLRELLGSHALGQLDEDLVPALVAHVGGCPECQAELWELRTVGLELSRVDVSAFGAPQEPPAQLRSSVLAAVRAERVLVLRRRRRSQIVRLSAVAASVAVLLAGVVATDRTLRDPVALPQPTPTATVPMEVVSLVSRQAGVTVSRSVVIPHSWGIELQMAATGLTDGVLYRGLVVAMDGRLLPAGEFLGVAGKTVKCNLQAAVLRGQAREFEIVDATGKVVLDAQLT